MRKEIIEQWLRIDAIRKKSKDKERAKSLINSAEINMKIVETIIPTEESAILLFRETYESIHQLGDAKWWLEGYEPRNHEVSMEILKELNIKEKTKLNHLNRFKSLRNDINYRGFKPSLTQAKEILEFWKQCSEEIIFLLKKELE